MSQPRGRCGWTDYAALLRLVVDRPLSSAEIAAAYGLSTNSVRRIMSCMAREGLVSLWAMRDGQEEVWGFCGPGLPLAPAEDRRPDLEAFCSVVLLLMERDFTVPEVAAKAQVWPERLRPAITSLEALRLVYIATWRSSRGPEAPAFRFGVDHASVSRHPPRHSGDPRRTKFLHRLERMGAVFIFATAGKPWPPR